MVLISDKLLCCFIFHFFINSYQSENDQHKLINDWSAILLCLPCIIFHEYMCGFFLFTEFWCFATRFSGCYKIWLSYRQNNIFVTKHLLAINNTTSE